MTDRAGPYRLGRHLGSGGNAIVRLGETDDGEHVAVKVLRRPGDDEALRRFRNEFDVQSGLSGITGVMPVLMGEVEAPDSGRPWYAMPVGERLESVWPEPSLDDVISFIQPLTEALAELHGREVAHRDLKPGNILVVDGRAVLADFGLVRTPETAGETEPNRPMGPRNFQPYEMLVDPGNADPYSADVYTLAKTIWVLVAGTRFPPPGEHHREVSGHLLAAVADHPAAESIDALLIEMTRHDPESRPSAERVAGELGAWLDQQRPREPDAPMDRSDVAGRIGALEDRRASRVARKAEADAARSATRAAQRAPAEAALVVFDDERERLRQAILAISGIRPGSSIRSDRPKRSTSAWHVGALSGLTRTGEHATTGGFASNAPWVIEALDGATPLSFWHGVAARREGPGLVIAIGTSLGTNAPGAGINLFGWGAPVLAAPRSKGFPWLEVRSTSSGTPSMHEDMSRLVDHAIDELPRLMSLWLDHLEKTVT